MEKYIEAVKSQIDIYKKLLKQNNDILNELNKHDFNIDYIDIKVENKNNLIKLLQQLDAILDGLWEDWENLQNSLCSEELDLVKNLKNLIAENFDLETVIINKMKDFLDKYKHETLKVSKGRKVLNAYKGIASNSSYFVNKKS